jgi:hypothetical protein
MKRRILFCVYLALNIVALFAAAMLWSFLTEKLRGFFGDINTRDLRGAIDMDWTWGYRHYLYFWMSFFLVIVAIVRMGMWIDWFWLNERSQEKMN